MTAPAEPGPAFPEMLKSVAIPTAPDPVQAAAIEDLAVRAADVSKRLAEHGIACNVQILRHQNGHVAVHFDTGADFFVRLGGMLADSLELGVVFPPKESGARGRGPGGHSPKKAAAIEAMAAEMLEGTDAEVDAKMLKALDQAAGLEELDPEVGSDS